FFPCLEINASGVVDELHKILLLQRKTWILSPLFEKRSELALLHELSQAKKLEVLEHNYMSYSHIISVGVTPLSGLENTTSSEVKKVIFIDH
ncbi:hypothetical protein ACJX0J_027818, partial [Zea mays]